MDSKDPKVSKPSQKLGGVGRPVSSGSTSRSSAGRPVSAGKPVLSGTASKPTASKPSGVPKPTVPNSGVKSAPKNVPPAGQKPSVTSPASAQQKMQKSMRGLAFTGGGVGSNKQSYTGVGLASSNNDKERKKVGGIVLDVDTIQDANKQKLDSRGNRRNIVLIIVLSVLLVLSLVYLSFTLMAYLNGKKTPNLKYSVASEVDANWVIEDHQETQFIVRKGLKKGKIYKIDSKLHIETTKKVNIEIVVKVTCKGTIVDVALMGIGDNFVNKTGTSVYEYKNGLEGGGTIDVFTGIDFKNAPSYLNSDNVRIDIIANITVA